MIPSSLEHYDALLFDLDGTLADSMKIHNQAWIETLRNLGCPITHETLYEFAGVPNEKTIEIFNQRFGWNLDPVSVAIDKEAEFLKNIEKISPIEPVLKIARENFKKNKPMAIVSGGSRALVERILSVLEIEELFSVRVCAEDVARGKPHPDPFLYAAKLLKVRPEKCIVFEDGSAGIQGAKAAGMAVVKVGSDFEMKLLD